MGMFLTRDEVVEALKGIGLYSPETHMIFVTVPAGGTANRYGVLSFTEKGIVIFDVDQLGKLSGTYDLIEAATIEAYWIKKILFRYKLVIQTSDAHYKLNVSPVMVGAKWHKEEFTIILNKNYYQKRKN